MNTTDVFQLILPSLKGGAVTSEQLWMEYGPQWHQLGWSIAQLRLWLSCVSPLQHCELPGGERAWTLREHQSLSTPTLADEMVALLQKAGRPMPLVQLISKLPTGMLATEPMLRSAAQQDNRLELKGPLLKLA
ncbi:hypothetical protein [Aeromonas veronii]|uniref:hypothetical protein n=1 Tax=Aeromonas veronii TaxID=654 RepID=UPI003D1A6529